MLSTKFDSKLISLEGNIGSGKSSLLNLIQDIIKDCSTLQEPVNYWQQINNNPNLNLLDNFYSDPKKWAFTFQSYTYFSRIKLVKEFQQKNADNQMQVEGKKLVCERSIFSDKLFAINARKAGLISEIEWELYIEFFNWISGMANMKLSGVIYLKTDPDICIQRIQRRGREEEKTSITLKYIQSLHDRHEEWLENKENLKFPVLVINGNEDYYNDNEKKEQLIQDIKNFIIQIK